MIGDEGVNFSYRIPSHFLNIIFSFTKCIVEIYTMASSIVTVIYHS